MTHRPFHVFLLGALLWFVSDVAFAQGLTFSINDVTTTEGNGGSNIVTFRISRSGTGSNSSVQFSTSNTTASGGSGGCSAGEDFLNLSSSVPFSASESFKDITITTCGDTLDEDNETFTVTLASPTGATIADGQGVATIADDDNPPSIRINDVTVAEGNAGATNATFDVRLSTQSGKRVTVVFASANDTASGGGGCGGAVDFVNKNETVTFDPGVTSRSIEISICGDTEIENDQRFRINLASQTNSTIADGTGIGTIRTDDTPNLTIADGNGNEPRLLGLVQGNIIFTLTLAPANPNGARVTYRTADVNATGGKQCAAAIDYLFRTGTVEFGPTETNKTISVPVCGDIQPEGNQTFQIQLSAGQGLNIADPTAVGTINDNN